MHASRWNPERRAAVARAALAGVAFAIPAVGLALLAHAPFAGPAPSARVLAAVTAAALLLAAIGEVVHLSLTTRRSPATSRHTSHATRRTSHPVRRTSHPVRRPPRAGHHASAPAPRRIGGPRSFGGLLAVQALLHGALALSASGGTGPAGLARGRPGAGLLADILLCHDRIPAPGMTGAAAAALRRADAPAALSARFDLGLARVDPALLAAARRLAAQRATGSVGGHGAAALAAGATPGPIAGAVSRDATGPMPGHAPASAVALAAAMPLAHAVAAALTLWWVRRGARVLDAASRLLTWRPRGARVPGIMPAPAAGVVRPRRADPIARPRLGLLRHAVARRGPPAGAAVPASRHRAPSRPLVAA
ncbi:conserved membrane hypothetical protein [Frankia canadensis]|uniref:Uncharacterized protein n=1 Tax=Frankia canadensis TaxID=1836972 RepID=A0A2I2KYI6_9ACTN|nr:hypothetical protein [Frankia canadensis]SNQ50719.1 conserved membrane hypothetical protein [Frankia canadensis]SOU58009.1 conserved membrane hypothetical protein [Frankia canadensis]